MVVLGSISSPREGSRLCKAAGELLGLEEWFWNISSASSVMMQGHSWATGRQQAWGGGGGESGTLLFPFEQKSLGEPNADMELRQKPPPAERKSGPPLNH